MGNGTAKNVIDYLDNLIDKGRGSQGAINPLKIAFTKVMRTVDGTNWQSVMVHSIGAEDYMDRFAKLTLGKYSRESLAAYKTRFTKVIEWYLQFLADPGWMPNIQRRAPRRQKTTIAIQSTISQQQLMPAPIAVPQVAVQQPDAPQVPAPALASPPDFITYPYPLSDGQLIQIGLPVRLSKLDARRIGAFIESIAVDD
jgi:hypothetical protein